MGEETWMPFAGSNVIQQGKQNSYMRRPAM
jgi:hypothetical protein